MQMEIVASPAPLVNWKPWAYLWSLACCLILIWAFVSTTGKLLLPMLVAILLIVPLWRLRSSHLPVERCVVDDSDIRFYRGDLCIWQGNLADIKHIYVSHQRVTLIELHFFSGESFSLVTHLYNYEQLKAIEALVR